jgi:hypothetical protein
MSPLIPNCNSSRQQQLTPNDFSRCTTGCTKEQSEGGITDPELARVAAAWPTLPNAIRRAVLALIGASAS